ncbi:hypothetical protein D8Q92_08240 [Salmonella enterica subsp. enterica serovar Weltevreden]|nr:hypothetical protein [Salmonella enterica subsp. enterica serovar Newport]EBV5145905.1 hypothetical protein [Salmonella enterica subsp. enterica serovar Newport]EBW9864713.1 hypothetical protein [Salmonella enterica subsp. enterica serovar Stanley]EBZ2052492.1 hypothetical protein [Salmonella enterica subsp. enterica serovar Weltevreden]
MLVLLFFGLDVQSDISSLPIARYYAMLLKLRYPIKFYSFRAVLSLYQFLLLDYLKLNIILFFHYYILLLLIISVSY